MKKKQQKSIKKKHQKCKKTQQELREREPGKQVKKRQN